MFNNMEKLHFNWWQETFIYTVEYGRKQQYYIQVILYLLQNKTGNHSGQFFTTKMIVYVYTIVVVQ